MEVRKGRSHMCATAMVFRSRASSAETPPRSRPVGMSVGGESRHATPAHEIVVRPGGRAATLVLVKEECAVFCERLCEGCGGSEGRWVNIGGRAVVC